MQASEFLVIVHSEQPDELVRFYRDVVELTPRFEMTPGAFSVSDSSRVDVIIERTPRCVVQPGIPSECC